MFKWYLVFDGYEVPGYYSDEREAQREADRQNARLGWKAWTVGVEYVARKA